MTNQPASSHATFELWDAIEVPVAVSSQSGLRYVNTAMARALGCSVEELLDTSLDGWIAPASRDLYTATLRSLLTKRSTTPQTQAIMLRARDGRTIATDHMCHGLTVSGEWLVVSTFLVVADRERIADALADSEQRYRELFEEDIDGRFVVTPDWRIIDVNSVLTRTLGCRDAAALVGRSLLDFTPDAPILQKLLAVTRVERRAGPAELQMKKADGALIDVSCSMSASVSDSGDLVSLRGQVTEITERKRLEMRLQGAERMEAIGRLAGGLAHDFNNLLTVISGNSERLLERLADHDPLKPAVAAIDQAAARAAAMTRQLLAYGRRQVFQLQPVSLAHLLRDAQPVLREIVGDHIRVHLDVQEDVPPISADLRQIEHVLANLAVNAREAMPSGGTLQIVVDAIEVGEDATRERAWLRPGRYARLVVADTGHGMDPVTKAYAFQPFFTTKRMGNGRGLGLATVYGIVKQTHGFVWVESEPMQGATFTILFPALASDRADQAAPVRAKGETILVVEEDAAVLAFAAEALRRRGYHVLTAGSSAAALQMFAMHPSRIHLVVSDSGMVTPQGVPLVARLKGIDSLVQSLAMLAPSAAGEGGPRVLPTTPAIQKPFTLQALADKVREVLDSGEGRGE